MNIGKWLMGAALSCLLLAPASLAQAQGDPLTAPEGQERQAFESQDIEHDMASGETLISANKLIGMEIKTREMKSDLDPDADAGTAPDESALDTDEESTLGAGEVAPGAIGITPREDLEPREPAMQTETIGEVGDIILDEGDNRIAYVVLHYGGVLGVGEKLFAVPWDALEPTMNFDGLDTSMDLGGDQALFINVSKEQFENSPGFDSDNYPSEPDPMFASSTATEPSREYGGEAEDQLAEPLAESEGEKAAKEASDWQRRLTSLIGTNIQGTVGEEFGSLDDVIIDSREGRVVYGIVAYGGTVGLFDKKAAVPWESIEVRPADEILAMDTTEAELEAVILADGDYKLLRQEEFSRTVHSSFDQEPYWYVYGYVAPAPTDKVKDKTSHEGHKKDKSEKEGDHSKHDKGAGQEEPSQDVQGSEQE
jgi:sporulation protein YlmC with PRC-barrel domain